MNQEIAVSAEERKLINHISNVRKILQVSYARLSKTFTISASPFSAEGRRVKQFIAYLDQFQTNSLLYHPQLFENVTNYEELTFSDHPLLVDLKKPITLLLYDYHRDLPNNIGRIHYEGLEDVVNAFCPSIEGQKWIYQFLSGEAVVARINKPSLLLDQLSHDVNYQVVVDRDTYHRKFDNQKVSIDVIHNINPMIRILEYEEGYFEEIPYYELFADNDGAVPYVDELYGYLRQHYE